MEVYATPFGGPSPFAIIIRPFVGAKLISDVTLVPVLADGPKSR